MAERFIVGGRVTDTDGRALAGATVRVFDKDLRSEQLVGEATTDTEGSYEIQYPSDQFRRAEKRSADLMFRVVTSEGLPVSILELRSDPPVTQDSGVIFNAPPQLH